MVGMARKNENSAAARLSAPISIAPTMVAPELQLVDDHQHEPAGDERAADEKRVEQHVLDEAAQEHPDHRRRQEGENDADDEAAGVRIARDRRRDLPQPREIDREQRQDRPELDQDGEGLVGLAFEAEEVLQEQEMACR